MVNVTRFDPWQEYRTGEPVDTATVKAALKAAQRRASDGESVTVPAGLYRLLVDLAAGRAVIQGGRPVATPTERFGRWITDPNILAACYAERLMHVWKNRYGHNDRAGAIRHAVKKVGGKAVEGKVKTVLKTGRHKRPAT